MLKLIEHIFCSDYGSYQLTMSNEYGRYNATYELQAIGRYNAPSIIDLVNKWWYVFFDTTRISQLWIWIYMNQKPTKVIIYKKDSLAVKIVRILSK